MKRKILAALLIMILALSGCTRAEKKRYQKTYLGLFDTVISVLGYEESEEAFSRATAAIYKELDACNRLYDIYQEYPDLVNFCTINRHPGETLEVDQRIIDLLVFARETDQMSQHQTDAMFGAVLRIWHEARENGIAHPEDAYVPDWADLEAAAKHTGFELVEIDSEHRTVCLKDPEASLDAGALAKGYTVQRISETLPEGYLLNAGGNVSATGPKPNGDAWIIGIQDPDGTAEAYLHKVSITKGAVVTSGDYQRSYTVDGVTYHHIIDPQTLYPAAQWRAVTVITEDSGLADALSTTLFLLNQEEGQKLLDQYKAEAFWVRKDGTQVFSPGYEAYIRP